MTPANTAFLADMIARGKYDFVNRCLNDGELSIPEGFALGRSPRIFGFDRDTVVDEPLLKMKLSGYEPAMFWDLLDYRVKHLEDDEYQNLAALGSQLEICGDMYAPGLALRGRRRELHLFTVKGPWFAPAHFLGVIRP